MPDRERSKAYPVEGLKESEQGAIALYRQFGEEPQSRETLVKGLGYKSAEGGLGPRRVAGFVLFGLFTRSKGKYSPTGLMQDLLRPRSQKEREAALRSALEHSALFKQLLARYRGQGRVPTELANVLIRDFGISKAAAARVARIFLESGRYAGVLDADANFVEAASATVHERSGPRVRPVEPGPSVAAAFEVTRSASQAPPRLAAADIEVLMVQAEMLAKCVEALKLQLEALRQRAARG